MAKLIDLITKREFGEPLPTFKGVMKQHQVNKLKEDWWDDMSPEDQASYIKDHPGSKQAQDAGGDEPEKITKGPGGYGDRGNVRGGDQRNFGEPDDEEYFKSMMGGDEDDYDMGVVPGSRELDDTPEDDSEKGSSLTSAPGRVPDEEPSGEPEGEPEGAGEPSGEKKPIPAKDLANDPNADTGPDSRGIAWSGDYSGAEDSAEWEEQYRETEEWADEYPEDAEKLAQIKWFGEKQGWGDRGELSSSARTGNELNQETLTINGKQYRRLTEGKINSKFIKYRIYDKISDEINKVELDDFNLRDFNSLKKPLIQFIHREIKRDKKITSGDLRQAIDKSDFDDEIFGRRGVIDDWYKESKKDFATFMKKYTTYSDNPKKGWKNYNASSLTYGIGKRLYKIVDSLLDEINNIVPESVHAFAEFYQRFKK